MEMALKLDLKWYVVLNMLILELARQTILPLNTFYQHSYTINYLKDFSK